MSIFGMNACRQKIINVAMGASLGASLLELRQKLSATAAMHRLVKAIVS